MKITRQYLIASVITWTISAGVFAAGYFCFLRPQNIALKEIRTTLSSTREQYTAAQLARNEQAWTELQGRLSDSRERLSSFVADSDQATGLTFQINKIAGSLNVADFTCKRNSSLSSQTIEESKEFGQVWLDVSFTAGFRQFAMFINQLERHRPFFFVEDYEIKRSENDVTKNSIRMSLVFLTGKSVVRNMP